MTNTTARQDALAEESAQCLSWSIKASFLQYLDTIEDFSIDARDGARHDTGSRSFLFPLTAREALLQGGVRLKFGGQVRLKAHGGMLLLILMDPWLELSAAGTELSVVDLMSWPDTTRRELIGWSAERPLAAGRELVEVPLQLADSGVEMFNGVYPAGTDLAPARFSTLWP
ncbi:hypothetical protein E7744_14805 (plasmid) [Citricoccus sp. SGAir0253]|uniref:HtaA domain-containing protein n=1 Tax=Citricoccus sp. SGAir0253 TaxID=2567881 RepID=UPI0010CD5DC4|nr:HtaA domain-containing protein [Citricoccus sp. SGAir0253]QCU79589.1 hypothetical protein E7744_14805 [Citricoccus sp. SGAir0253]